MSRPLIERQGLATLAGLGLLAVAFISGISVGRSGHNPVPVAGDKPDESLVQQVGRYVCDLRLPSGYTSDDGCPVAQGKGFRAGFHTVKDGWAIKAGKDGPVLVATVVNDNPGAVAGFHHTFHLKRYDGTLVEILWCETPAFAAGESRAVTCAPLQPESVGPHDEVWIHY